MDTKKRERTPNFTNSERVLLIHIAVQFKSILENKKTDATTNEMKNEAWLKITDQFNSQSSTYRSVESLKRLYDNRKKIIRKQVAEERKNVMKTGGGPYSPIEKEEGDELLLSVLNKKTVYGLPNKYDSDQPSSSNAQLPSCYSATKPCTEINNFTQKNVEVFVETRTGLEDDYQILTEITHDNEVEVPELINENQEEIKIPSMESNVKPTYKKAEDLRTKISKQLSTPCKSSRRRPTIVKALTTSDLAEKYNKLLDAKLEFSLLQKRKIEESIKNEAIEHKLRTELLTIQIQKEKMKL